MIKIIRSTVHLGYAYRAGDTAELPDKVAKMLVDGGYAVFTELKKRPKEKKEVITPVVSRTKKR